MKKTGLQLTLMDKTCKIFAYISDQTRFPQGENIRLQQVTRINFSETELFTFVFIVMILIYFHQTFIYIFIMFYPYFLNSARCYTCFYDSNFYNYDTGSGRKSE